MFKFLKNVLDGCFLAKKYLINLISCFHSPLKRKKKRKGGTRGSDYKYTCSEILALPRFNSASTHIVKLVMNFSRVFTEESEFIELFI